MNNYFSLQPDESLHIIFHFHYRLSFAVSASKIKEKARVVAMDLRGHGKSLTEDDLDLSVEVKSSK